MLHFPTKPCPLTYLNQVHESATLTGCFADWNEDRKSRRFPFVGELCSQLCTNSIPVPVIHCYIYNIYIYTYLYRYRYTNYTSIYISVIPQFILYVLIYVIYICNHLYIYIYIYIYQLHRNALTNGSSKSSVATPWPGSRASPRRRRRSRRPAAAQNTPGPLKLVNAWRINIWRFIYL